MSPCVVRSCLNIGRSEHFVDTIIIKIVRININFGFETRICFDKVCFNVRLDMNRGMAGSQLVRSIFSRTHRKRDPFMFIRNLRCQPAGVTVS